MWNARGTRGEKMPKMAVNKGNDTWQVVIYLRCLKGKRLTVLQREKRGMGKQALKKSIHRTQMHQKQPRAERKEGKRKEKGRERDKDTGERENRETSKSVCNKQCTQRAVHMIGQRARRAPWKLVGASPQIISSHRITDFNLQPAEERPLHRMRKRERKHS